MIEVVSAVICRAGRILLTQRRHNKSFPFTWEAPGGGAERNEGHIQALNRELQEEIDCHLLSWTPEPIWNGKFESSRAERREIFLSLYGVGIVGEPRPLEGQGIGWFTPEEFSKLTLAPGNAAAEHAILGWVSKQK